MTFVLSIPKINSREWSAATYKERSDRLNRIGRRYELITQPGGAADLVVSSPSSASQMMILADEDRFGRLTDFAADGSNWSLSAGTRVASDLLNSLTRRAGFLQYARPVWGSYAAVYGETDSNRVTAWNTVPSVESICFAETPTELIIGNRPLLVALTAAGGSVQGIGLDKGFLIEYLLYGYSMSGQMPYEGVRALSADTALVVQDGKTSVINTPHGLTSGLNNRPTVEEGADALVEGLRNATRRVEQRMDGHSIQIRLSGGKDSRMLMGLLRSSTVPVYGRVFGRHDDDDVILARYMAGAADIDLEVGAAPLVEGSSIRERAETVLRQTDGLPLSEAHAGVYAGAMPKNFGDGIMLGQWPLAKGGAAKKMRYTDEEVYGVIKRQGAPFVNKGHRAPMDSYFDEWLRTTPSSSNLDTLYLFSRNFRSTRWMQGLLHMYSRDSHPVYPLADAEVTAVSDALQMGDKVSQAAYFLALDQVWPLATRTPFGSSRWPFDARGRERSIAPELYDVRNGDVGMVAKDMEEGISSSKETGYDSLSGAAGSAIAAEICASDNFGYFEDILEPDFIRCLIGWSNRERKVYENQTWRVTLSLIWRVYLADLWLSREWLDNFNV